jgi:hypothetical protein
MLHIQSVCITIIVREYQYLYTGGCYVTLSIVLGKVHTHTKWAYNAHLRIATGTFPENTSDAYNKTKKINIVYITHTMHVGVKIFPVCKSNPHVYHIPKKGARCLTIP